MKLIIADDHDLVRDALTTLVERDNPESTVYGACEFDEVLSLLELHPDVDIVLLDVIMPGMNNMTSVRELCKSNPGLPIVMMSGHINQGDVERGFEMGASGFIPKTMSGKALISVLQLVMSGARYVPDLVLGDDVPQKTSRTSSVELSVREKEVLNQLAKGLSNKLIAKNLNIEETTVKLHLRSLFKKLEVKNRTEAVINAIETGLISES